MCGIFGLVNTSQEVVSGQFFRSLCLMSESRGKEASGFAVIDNKRIKVFKAPFPASEMVKSKIFKQEILSYDVNCNFTAIGHSRLVTNGYEHEDENNQPVVRNGYIIIHNGIVVNQQELWRKYKDEGKNSELDSELFPVMLFNKEKQGLDIGKSVGEIFAEIEGMSNLAILSINHSNLILATNNGSIYYIDDFQKGFFAFASERYILEKLSKKYHLNYHGESIKQLLPNKILSVDLVLRSTALSVMGELVSNTNQLLKSLDVVQLKKVVSSKRIFLNTSLDHDVKPVNKSFIDLYESRHSMINNLRRCTKCILPETFPYIEFNEKGECNYCTNFKKHELKGTEELEKLVDSYRRNDGKAECLVPFSGGRDSSYTLHYIVKNLGLKPIAFSYDWGMITDLARRNQARMCGQLGVEHLLVSADIRKKRTNIRKNVLAWLRKPSLGTVPLFMAGDKQYFYFANKLMNENGLSLSILGENLLENTNFKYGFCRVKPNFDKKHTYSLNLHDKVKMAAFYGGQYILNPAYLNSSLLDTLEAFKSYYLIKHNNINIYDFIKWDEDIIEKTLIDDYNWETDSGTRTTWRIGDGTAAFYNYIYYMLAGFTENDTFRSNQIREEDLSRDEALELTKNENKPRWDSLQWYCRTIGIDFYSTIDIINKICPHYDKIR